MPKAQIKAVTITRGPRKGQRILAYVYPSGKYTEIRGKGRGATKQRRSVARAAGLKDRFGHTAADRSRIRHMKLNFKLIQKLVSKKTRTIQQSVQPKKSAVRTTPKAAGRPKSNARPLRIPKKGSGRR